MAERLALFFDRGASRLRALAILRAEAAALALGLPVALACWLGAATVRTGAIAGAVLAVAAAAIAVVRTPRRRDAVAAEIERRTPAPRNLLITAAELLGRSTPVRPDVRDVVLRDAADAASRVDLGALFPRARAAGWLALVVALWAVGLGTGSPRFRALRAVGPSATSGPPVISRVTITVTPPAYTGRASSTTTDPERIDALAGSDVRVVVQSSGDRVALTSGDARYALTMSAPGEFSGQMTASAEGFLAIQPFRTTNDSGEDAGLKRVIALGVTPDRPPVARITAPGKDLFLAAASSTLPVRIEASDDIGLGSLRLTYTKVTGGGENFTFTAGEFPLQIARASPQSWTAATSMALPSLGLQPGDLLVYRAVVGDTRPGATAIESDAFVIQILTPGEALAEGFAVDDDKDRYAISQQMIIVKTEKLIADKPRITAESFAEQSAKLAAEQRHVRAEFVFMMGGEFEDATEGTGELNEENEAANESELLAGRMQNNGRRDIIQATRFMSAAAQGLAFADLAKALPAEKAALAALQRAFTKSRYILRVLTPRERIDDQRRLTGKMEGAASWRRPPAASVDDPRARALLSALASVEAIEGRAQYSAADANRLTTAAEAILRADPSLAKAAQPFTQAASAAAAGRPNADVAALVSAGTAQLSQIIRAALASAPAAADPSDARLRGAVADLHRKGGGR